MITDT